MELNKIRSLFREAGLKEDACNRLLKMTEDAKSDVLKSYFAAGKMIAAQYASWPFRKLELFNEGKRMLEECLYRSPDHVEIRYIRYNIQKHSPFFLNYNKNKEEDKRFMESWLRTSSDRDSELKKLIREVLDDETSP